MDVVVVYQWSTSGHQVFSGRMWQVTTWWPLLKCSKALVGLVELWTRLCYEHRSAVLIIIVKIKMNTQWSYLQIGVNTNHDDCLCNQLVLVQKQKLEGHKSTDEQAQRKKNLKHKQTINSQIQMSKRYTPTDCDTKTVMLKLLGLRQGPKMKLTLINGPKKATLTGFQ